MGIKVFGVGMLGVKLVNNAQRSARGVSDALKQGGADIERIARLMAPIDEANLENAITHEVVRSGRGGRVSIEIYVDEYAGGTRADSVADYALIMHEGRGSIWHELGEKSQAKNGTSQYRVGEKFLDRAADEMHDEIVDKVHAIYKKQMGAGL
jgi:hypothetical protein